MGRKITEGPVRNKEKSKQKFLAAVGKILKTKGFSALKVNNIAATAGLDKKLIYNYFGGTEQLIDAYIRSQDFWGNVWEFRQNWFFVTFGESILKNYTVLMSPCFFLNVMPTFSSKLYTCAF